MELTDMTADISDGRGFFAGTVHDVSRFGLALDNIPAKMDSHADFLTIIVVGRGGHFRLKIRPRWESVTGRQKCLGGLIENTPFTWNEFVMRLETEKNDIWGNW
jgi:hypothetical protein